MSRPTSTSTILLPLPTRDQKQSGLSTERYISRCSGRIQKKSLQCFVSKSSAIYTIIARLGSAASVSTAKRGSIAFQRKRNNPPMSRMSLMLEVAVIRIQPSGVSQQSATVYRLRGFLIRYASSIATIPNMSLRILSSAQRTLYRPMALTGPISSRSAPVANSPSSNYLPSVSSSYTSSALFIPRSLPSSTFSPSSTTSSPSSTISLPSSTTSLSTSSATSRRLSISIGSTYSQGSSSFYQTLSTRT